MLTYWFHSAAGFIEKIGVDQKEMRKCDVGMYSYALTCRIFLERFHLKRILFKTPIQKLGALRVKEKLGIRNIDEEIIDFGIIKADTQAKAFN